MRFADLYSDVETLSQVTGQRAFIKRAVQRTLDRIAGNHPWPFYLVEDRTTLLTVDDYTTGTIAVTNGSASVTGTGTTFTSAMVGRKIRVGSDSIYYTIASFTSATEITLDQSYQGTTDSAATFVIYQDVYRLAGDVDRYHFFRQMENGVQLLDVDPGDFDLVYPAADAYGDPRIVVPLGRGQDTYTTGSVSATVGTTTITGSSTAWLSVQGLTRGNRIRIGDNVYTIRSVDSATSITTYESIVVTVSAGTAYAIFLDNIRVQFHEIPDAARYIYYRYWRKPAPLVNDYDEPDLPPNFHWVLIPGALTEAWMYKGFMDRVEAADKRFLAGLVQMRDHYTTDRIYQRVPSIIGQRVLRGPRYPLNYGADGIY